MTSFVFAAIAVYDEESESEGDSFESYSSAEEELEEVEVLEELEGDAERLSLVSGLMLLKDPSM